MAVEQRINDFVRYLRFEKRYSRHTILAYENDLNQFSEYISDQFGVEDAEHVAVFHARSWLASLRDEQHHSRTVNRKLSVLNSFYKYLMRLEVVKVSPVAQLHAMRTGEQLPVYLREGETRSLLEDADFGEGFRGFTDRMICDLLYQTGIRRSELLHLKECNVDWYLKQIRVTGKGNKERIVPVHEVLLDDLRAYINDKKDIPDADNDHLLILETGRPLYEGYVYRTVKRYLGMVTTLKKKSPHVLRHSFATHLLNNGANIQAIKDLLGHSSLAATQVYTHNQIDRLKEIHKRNHPRG